MKPWWRLSSYLVFLLSVSLIGLEVLLRLFLPSPSLSTSQKFRQDIAGLKSEFTYERNEWGLRSLSMKTLAKPEDTFRVIVLGASTTDQATQSTADTWTGLLETNWQQTYAPLIASKKTHVEVAAYGRGGDTIYDTLCWARDNLIELDPDMVIVLQAVNDLAWNGGPGYFFDPKNPPPCSSFMTQFPRHHSEVFRWVIHLKNQWRVKKSLAEGGAVEWHSQNLPEIRRKFAELPLQDPATRLPDPFTEFAQGYAALIQFVAIQHHIPMRLFTQPAVWRKNMSEIDKERLWFSVNTPEGPVRVATTHLHYRLQDGQERADQVLACHDVLARHEGEVRVLLGDLNATPDSDEVRFLCGKTALGGRHAFYQDAWALHHEGEPGHTWAKRNHFTSLMHWLQPGRRIDYILVSPEEPGGRAEVLSCAIALDQSDPDGVFASDHFAVMADVRIGPR